ncbi:phosphopentomutase [Photobacterium sp. ZSDE20]|uniref:Phosphopentomutase n=1 Tax=Photobacterium pectinilyticum TaxID=2906793 RepID=A0ABT1MVW0_9GAMM|nr:phosphopentomutase [Photobacterium sp. ZSDE20]MCQ1056631.1 phosphopentomutase [Photobacterium sp. ZSDE20]MDD1820766.1 phosphopentomutase [Photobacterium sp. ZSDE20]
MAKFVVVVLDGFGVGEMPDVTDTRPQDCGANTAVKLLDHFPLKRLPTLEQLGLINITGLTRSVMQPSPCANWGTAKLAHYGCDTFMGHQEIMGTLPKPPMIKPFQESIDSIEHALKQEGYPTERITRGPLQLLMVKGCVVIGDNLEADLGQVYNLTANFNQISFDEVKQIAMVVRGANAVSRNIAFGGFIPSMDRVFSAIETKTDQQGKLAYIGVNAPDSGAYDEGFQVVHMGFGVDAHTQTPHQLAKVGVPTYLYGKVADIVLNESGTSYTSVVDTDQIFSLLLHDLDQRQGFFCANIQETDLSGHLQDPKRYWQVLEKADRGLAATIDTLNPGDVLIVMADHGNDPFIGHTKHTREQVPLMLFSPGVAGIPIGYRDTLADIGTSAAAFFGASPPESGRPLQVLRKLEQERHSFQLNAKNKLIQ